MENATWQVCAANSVHPEGKMFFLHPSREKTCSSWTVSSWIKIRSQVRGALPAKGKSPALGVLRHPTIHQPRNCGTPRSTLRHRNDAAQAANQRDAIILS